MKIDFNIEKEESTRARIAYFAPQHGCKEMHVLFQSDVFGTFEQQANLLKNGIEKFCERHSEYTLMFCRVLMSDASNQQAYTAELMKEVMHGATLSIVQQPPLDGRKISVLAYFATEMSQDEKRSFIFHHNGYNHLWLSDAGGKYNSYLQSVELLTSQENLLKELGMTTLDNCIRTWFYVQNIDVDYSDMVNGRKSAFNLLGLKQDTHYIASTGIEGRTAASSSIILFDSYNVKGLQKEQVQYLHALTHLNPTYEYGVTFERGTAVSYGDRKHLFLSGTASINNKGEIMHVSDVVKQTLRMWENSEALLSEAGGTMDDFAHIVVYLRDYADYETIKKMFEDRFPHTPFIIVHAPVCRPGWLIEMEGIAIIENNQSQYANF